MIHTLWRHITEIGGHYGVNPALFAVLYLAHHPLFWGTMAWLAARVRRKRPVAAVVALGVFFWFLPYLATFSSSGAACPGGSMRWPQLSSPSAGRTLFGRSGGD